MKLKIIFALLTVLAIGGLACRHNHQAMSSAAEPKRPIYYICPMHPSVKVAQPGECPICGMKLVPAFTEIDSGSAAPCGAACCVAPGATNQP